MTDKIRAPWTREQVAALNEFQRRGGMHPFTCGHEHPAHPNAILDARTDGWHCYVLDCDYEQDWAHAFMANPSAWPKWLPNVTDQPTPSRRASLRDEADEAAPQPGSDPAEVFVNTVADIIADHEGDEWADHSATRALRAAITRAVTPTEPAATEATHDHTCTDNCRGVTGIRGLLEHVGIDTRGHDITVSGRLVDPAPFATCGHSIQGAFDRPLGPCTRRLGHSELFHRDDRGAEWRTTRSTSRTTPDNHATSSDAADNPLHRLIADALTNAACSSQRDYQVLPHLGSAPGPLAITGNLDELTEGVLKVTQAALREQRDRQAAQSVALVQRNADLQITLRQVLDAFEAYWARASYCGPEASAVQPEHFQAWRSTLNPQKEPTP